jgi:hypothetical protein
VILLVARENRYAWYNGITNWRAKQVTGEKMSDKISPTSEQVATLKARVFVLVQACPACRVTTYGLIATSP